MASALDDQREQICAEVTARMAAAFPLLCYDPTRPDAIAFQQQTFRETPQRLHRLIQAVLRFHVLTVVEHEYQWGWTILPRYGVEQHHLLAQMRFYFAEARARAMMSSEDRTSFDSLEATILQIIEDITK